MNMEVKNLDIFSTFGPSLLILYHSRNAVPFHVGLVPITQTF